MFGHAPRRHPCRTQKGIYQRPQYRKPRRTDGLRRGAAAAGGETVSGDMPIKTAARRRSNFATLTYSVPSCKEIPLLSLRAPQVPN